MLVIITGHSYGLGKAMAEHYLDQGILVLGISRTIWTNHPVNLIQESVDLSNLSEVISFLQEPKWKQLLFEHESIILINNAGTVIPSCMVGQASPTDIEKAITLNVTAPLILSNSLLQLTRETQRKTIVHISSGAGRKPYPAWSIYGATKAALDQHAICLAAEKHQNLKIMSIAPGVVDTSMQAQLRALNNTVFPIQQRFINLFEKKELQGAQETARRIIQMMEDPLIKEVCLDVRTYGMKTGSYSS